MQILWQQFSIFCLSILIKQQVDHINMNKRILVAFVFIDFSTEINFVFHSVSVDK